MRAAETLRAATLKAEYNEARREERCRLRPPQKEAWRAYLQERAQAGDGVALRALRQMDDSARAADGLMISSVGHQADEDERKRHALAVSTVLKALRVHVERNGDVTYSRHGQAVLRDQGERLQVLDSNSDEAIIAGLTLAQHMYGRILTLTGPEDFQRRVVALAAERGMPIKFEDPRLEAMRAQFHASKAKPRFIRTPSTDQVPNKDSQQEVSPEPALFSSTMPAFDELAPVQESEAAPASAMDPSTALRAERAELEASLQAQGREIRKISDGVLYVGQVRVITPSGLVVQSVSRDAVVIHDLAQLDGRYEVGQSTEIEYREGGGADRLQVQTRDHDQGLDR